MTAEWSVEVATAGGTGFGKLTRLTSGGNLPPSEVIMSRRQRQREFQVPKLKELIRNFGFDSVVLGATGLIALCVSILDFVGWLKLTPDQLLQMILVALGLLMISVITQTSRRATESVSCAKQ